MNSNNMPKNITLQISTISVRKDRQGNAKRTAVHRDRTEYTRKLKHRSEL